MGLCLITVHTLTANMEPRLADARFNSFSPDFAKDTQSSSLSRSAGSEISSRSATAGETPGDGDYNTQQITRVASDNDTVRNTGWHGTCLLILPWEIPVARSPPPQGRVFTASAVTASTTERQTRQFAQRTCHVATGNRNELANAPPLL